MLRQAAESREQLMIGYVGNDGTVAERTVRPERVEGGQLTAYDERSDASRVFAMHRITAVTRPVAALRRSRSSTRLTGSPCVGPGRSLHHVLPRLGRGDRRPEQCAGSAG